MLALLPAIAAYVFYYGPGILIQFVLASGAAVLAEAAMLKARGVPVRPFLLDGSALVTAWLIALSMPPLAPWWLVVVGTGFAIVVAKHLYGGLGNNIFNPAMVGFAVLLISFPVQMTLWPAPESAGYTLNFWQSIQAIFQGAIPKTAPLDAVTMATPLDTVKTQLQLQHTVNEIARMPIFGAVGGKGTEVVALLYLVGGLWLVQQRIITWHIPAAFLAALFAIATLFFIVDGDRFTSPWFHLATGGAMLGAFFIATDPVTGATTPKGKLIFGAAIGILTYLIRVFGGYPDGVAFAVLLLNICVPLIDAHTRPPAYGHKPPKADE